MTTVSEFKAAHSLTDRQWRQMSATVRSQMDRDIAIRQGSNDWVLDPEAEQKLIAIVPKQPASSNPIADFMGKKAPEATSTGSAIVHKPKPFEGLSEAGKLAHMQSEETGQLIQTVGSYASELEGLMLNVIENLDSRATNLKTEADEVGMQLTRVKVATRIAQEKHVEVSMREALLKKQVGNDLQEIQEIASSVQE